ncbi:protein bcn92 [Drosophila grimshawi]|uniref:GH24400 n=1 Tax=Drosophila grimshawi TaxID=7222 RepID=B4JM40_DROGR|nr:protein bcn92 [Drosophila grimshawi]EDV91801.1 GH24400 [Drosophila grimshawi]
MSTRRQAITLYRNLLRESEKLPSYNFRMYAARKIRDTFRANKVLKDFNEIDRQMASAKENLELIRRQVIIGHLYTTDKLVIEQKKTLRPSDD